MPDRLVTKSWSWAVDVVVIDQISKFVMMKFTSPIVQGDVLFLQYRLFGDLNTNFAFSVPAPYLVIMASVIAVLAAVLYWWWQEILQRRQAALALAVVIGGAVSNLIDRIRLGGVYDWIEIGIKGVSSSHFNLADVAIVAGVLVFLALHKRTQTI